MMTWQLGLKIVLARMALAWERFWQCAWPAAAVIAIALALAASGIAELAAISVRVAIGGLIAAALIWSLSGFRHFIWPSRAQAVRRVEQKSGLAHRPASGVADRLADEDADPARTAIWQAHRMRLLAGLTHLKAGAPEPALAQRDPYAFRLVALLALVAGLALSQGNVADNLAAAVRTTPLAAAPVFSADAWITPPAYTGKPPVMLTSPALREALAQGEAVSVPQGSLLTVRISGASDPQLQISTMPTAPESATKMVMRKSGTVYSADAKLTATAMITLSEGGKDLERWPVTVIPDQKPAIRFVAKPMGDASGTLVVQWAAEDDYGVSRITAEIQLADVQNGELGLAGNGYFLFEPPNFPVALKKQAAKSATGKTANNLTAHAWAGLNVEMTLTAIDAAGQAVTSEIETFQMPERQFRMPLAQALVEQRKAVIAEPDETQNVRLMLSALAAFPEGLIEESGVAIGMAAVESRLRNSRNWEDAKQAITLLWDIALAVEEGDIAGAKAELEAIRKDLEQALRDGAPPERIAELMQKLRKAMDRYTREMAEAQRKAMERGGKQPKQGQNGKTITEQDLKKMLDQIERLSRNGANDAAREMLSQLDELLRNLEPGGQANRGSPQSGPLSEMLDELSDLMRRQQKLMDDTGRMPSPQDGQPGDNEGGNDPGSRGQRPSDGDLAGQQGALERMLEDLRNRLGQQGLAPPSSLGEAGRSMGDATEALRDGDGQQALGNQGDALQALREGARDMARQLNQQQGQSTGSPGDHGEARGDDRDPLGRPTATTGEDRGPDRNMLPSETAIRRAREILDMLRGRANDPDRPRIERDYLERLLRGLY